MQSINSLSGGKTSSYMAASCPADYNVFALVRIEADYCKPKDESIVRYVSEKINMEFVATAESDKTLYVMRDLEQLIGKEITWVTGETFDRICLNRKALPNMMWRFCTTEMKMQPIFDWWQNEFAPEKVWMNIGFRYDEIERGYDKNGNKREEKPFKHIVGKLPDGRNKWGETHWRHTNFPLINTRITHWDVKKWAASTPLIFPKDSNCVGCFWKPIQQLRKNWEDEPLKMRWVMELEQKMRRKFKKEMTYERIKSIGLQQDFFFGTGSGCQAGFCTD